MIPPPEGGGSECGVPSLLEAQDVELVVQDPVHTQPPDHYNTGLPRHRATSLLPLGLNHTVTTPSAVRIGWQPCLQACGVSPHPLHPRRWKCALRGRWEDPIGNETAPCGSHPCFVHPRYSGLGILRVRHIEYSAGMYTDALDNAMSVGSPSGTSIAGHLFTNISEPGGVWRRSHNTMINYHIRT